jgi:hypothetical protein
MRVPGAAELLDIWEVGASLPPPRRALLLLAASCPEAGRDELAALPVGDRDARLLQLREHLFGTELTLVAACPACDELLQSRLRTADIRPGPERTPASTNTFSADGYEVSFRLPVGADLIALNEAADADTARSLLLARCVVQARDPDGDSIEPQSLPAPVIATIAAQMAAADPQADVRLDLACPACAHHWQAMFDIATFLWSELQAWARRTLREIDVLARAYGWRETDVLALSPTRRQIYLELARQ